MTTDDGPQSTGNWQNANRAPRDRTIRSDGGSNAYVNQLRGRGAIVFLSLSNYVNCDFYKKAASFSLCPPWSFVSPPQADLVAKFTSNTRRNQLPEPLYSFNFCCKSSFNSACLIFKPLVVI